MFAIPLIGSNIYIASAVTGKSTEEIQKMIVDSNSEYANRKDMDFILEFFNSDDVWYNNTKEKIKQISSTIPDGMDVRERTIKTYGWIKNEVEITKSLSIPMETDFEYGAARVIEMIINGQIDLYHKVMSWD